jgi:hypothetical protein
MAMIGCPYKEQSREITLLAEMSAHMDDDTRVPEDEDIEYVVQCQKGDTEAFAVIVERHQKKMLNMAYRMTGNYEDACDVVQEAFLSAYRSLKTFRRESRFSSKIKQETVYVLLFIEYRICGKEPALIVPYDRPEISPAAGRRDNGAAGPGPVQPDLVRLVGVSLQHTIDLPRLVVHENGAVIDEGPLLHGVRGNSVLDQDLARVSRSGILHEVDTHGPG